MQAPLGLAVIGGLVMSTFATLLVLPSIFAVVIGKRVARSPSIYPDDPNSAHYDPLVYAHGAESAHPAAGKSGQPTPPQPQPGERAPASVHQPIAPPPRPDHIHAPDDGPPLRPAPSSPPESLTFPGDL
jgi:hypothetical protein